MTSATGRPYAWLAGAQSGVEPSNHCPQKGIIFRYFKRVLWITECNGRVSELRGKGYDIKSSSERDAYGFVYLRLEKDPQLNNYQ
jgi:hypothetical protein